MSDIAAWGCQPYGFGVEGGDSGVAGFGPGDADGSAVGVLAGGASNRATAARAPASLTAVRCV